MKINSKSIEQLENDYWKEPSEFPTGIVERCYRFRKIKIADLTNEQLRVLISQKIGLKYLIEIALNKLERNILAEGDIYEGDLLEAVSRIPTEFWIEKQIEFHKLERLVESNSEKIITEMGGKNFDRINERIKAIAQQWL